MPQFITQATIRKDLDDFTRGYVECALWLMDGEDDDRDTFSGEISDEAYTSILADCARFRAINQRLLVNAEKLGESDAQAGHDFFLTRNGHGAGFWDRGLGEVGERLSDAARVYGEADVYIGDDGKAYVG